MKKLLIGALAALLSLSGFAATLNPIQLLSPAGSTSGQVIASTGPSSAPAWTSLTGVALTANPLSQFASTTSAQLAGVLSDETGSGLAVFGTSPTITTPVITGVTNAGTAAAGAIGEGGSVTVTGVSLTSGTPANVTSQSLTAGDWDVSASVGLVAASSGALTSSLGGISTTSATVGAAGTYWQLAFGIGANGGAVLPTPIVRINVAATTTVYCIALGSFSSGAVAAQCTLRWRRVH